MSATKFLGRVLEDGHLSLPKEVAEQKGREFEVVLVSNGEKEIFGYAESLARQKGFDRLTEEDVARIVQEVRGKRS